MGNKKDLILLHGAMGSKLQFNQLCEAIDQDFNVHYFDLPSHGSLAHQRDSFSIFNFSNFVHSKILAKQLVSPIVFGFSMGGYIALTLQSQTNIFDRIMTLNTKFEWNNQTAEREMMKLNPDVILEKVPYYADYLISQHREENWRHLLSEHKNLMFRIANSNPLTNHSLSKINVPVLISRGSEDNMVNREESLDISNKLQYSEYFEFKNTHHPIEKINLEILSTKMKEFFI